MPSLKRESDILGYYSNSTTKWQRSRSHNIKTQENNNVATIKTQRRTPFTQQSIYKATTHNIPKKEEVWFKLH
jgi:hypothetical protein